MTKDELGKVIQTVLGVLGESGGNRLTRSQVLGIGFECEEKLAPFVDREKPNLVEVPKE